MADADGFRCGLGRRCAGDARIAAGGGGENCGAAAGAAGAGARGDGGRRRRRSQACGDDDPGMYCAEHEYGQPAHSGGMQCSFTNRVQTAQGASYDISCTGPMGSAQGHTSYHATDDEHFSSTIHLTVNGKSQGQSMTMTRDMSTTGTYVSADCGDVKPMGAAPAK